MTPQWTGRCAAPRRAAPCASSLSASVSSSSTTSLSLRQAYTDSFTEDHERDTIREWVNETVAEMLITCPSSVVEMGCGKGMILYRVAEKPLLQIVRSGIGCAGTARSSPHPPPTLPLLPSQVRRL